jgi:Flp pilus assembly protein TadD
VRAGRRIMRLLLLPLVLLLLAFSPGPAFSQSAPAQPAKDPEPILKQAVQLHRSGDFTRAIALYREYLKARPSSPDVLSNLGAALAHEGRYPEAIAEYNKALKLKPANPQALANLALAYYKTGEFPQAREKLLAVRPLLPGSSQIAMLLADCDLRLGDFKAAIAILEPLGSDLDSDDGFNYLLATALIRDGQPERGSIYIDRILRRGDSAEARLLLGTSKLAVRDYPGAREDLEKAVELNPKLPEAHAWLGEVLASIGDGSGAAAAFRAELALDPNNYTATFELGVIETREDHPAEARKLLGRSLTLRPGDVESRYQLALMDLAEGQLEKARLSLEALVKEIPDFTAAHVNLATVYYRLQRREDGDRERAIVRSLNAAEQAKQPAAGAPAAISPPAETFPGPQSPVKR